CGVNLINGICLNCTYGDGKPVTCCGCEGPLNGGFCSFCASRAGNSFAYDPNPNSFDDSQNLSDYPPQPQYQTYSCELCGNDAHYGYDCPPQVPFVYNQDPCFNQNFDDFPQTSPSFPQQFLCCENCEGPHETFQCQPMNQNFYNSNSSGFDQFQPPAYIRRFITSKEVSIEELKTMMQSYCEIMSQRREQEAILLQDEEKQELLAEEHAANPSEPSPVSYFYNADYDNISTPSTTYTIHLTKSATIITNPSELTRRIYHNHDIFYDGDDDEDLLPNFLLIRVNLIISSLKFDSLLEEFSGKLAHIDLIPPGIYEADFDPEEEIHLVERLLYDNSSPRPPKEFNSENSDAIIEPFSPSPIPVEDSDSLMEEIDLFLTPDDSMPPGIENDDYDSEGDILFLEELLSNDSPSLHENESFHFDVPSSPRPPAKPPDDGIYFEPDTGVFTKVVDDISDNSTRELYVHVPNVLTTPPTLSPHLLSHRGFNPSKIISDFSKSPMMISGGDIPILDVPIAPDYEASRARGFVLRSLELQHPQLHYGNPISNLID
ncbi:hypothetical protein Tco_0307876, partial [Tanacetum coccineum]